MGSDCISSWSLLIFLLFIKVIILSQIGKSHFLESPIFHECNNFIANAYDLINRLM